MGSDDGRHAAPADGPRADRLAAVDGLRGLAILLVVASHLWVVWPSEAALASPLGGLLRSGNLAVSVFLVLAGFFLTRSLLADAGSGGVEVRETVLRRWARISAHVYPLLVVLVLVTLLGPAGTYDPADTPRSVLHVATYTWNWFAIDQPLVTRPDLGHLWFTSVYLQVAVGLVLLVAALGRRRRVLTVVLAALVVAVTVWRARSAATDGEWVAFLRTTTRMDGLVWGALLAAVLPRLPRPDPRGAAAALGTGLALLLGLFLTARDSTYFGWAGVLGCLATCLVLWGVVSGASGPAARILAVRPLVTLGTYSMAVYIWHYPVFWAVSLDTPTWHAPEKTLLALALAAVLAVAADRLVERPVTRWLARRRRTRPPRVRAPRTPAPGLRER